MLHTVLYFHELKNSTQRLSTKFGSVFNFPQSFSLRIVFILLKIRELSLKVFHKVWFSVLNITQSFSAENCLYIAKIRKLSLKVFHKVWFKFSIITQDFSFTNFINFLAKKQERSVLRQFGKYIVCNVSRLKNCGVNSTPSQYKYNKTFHSTADFPQENPKPAIFLNRC